MNWVFLAARGISLAVESGSYSLVGRLLIATTSFVSESGLQSAGIRGCGNRLSCPTEGVESSWTRDGIHVPCIGRWIFNRWITREVCFLYF